jgi:hypothetical protein
MEQADQLINLIIYQGRRRPSASHSGGYPYALSESVSELWSEPGSRDHQLNQSQGAGIPMFGLPVKGIHIGCTVVSVTAAHLQLIDTIHSKRGCCPDVAQ